jgi:hypothetical protein
MAAKSSQGAVRDVYRGAAQSERNAFRANPNTSTLGTALTIGSNALGTALDA